MNREVHFFNAIQEHRVRINDYNQRPDLMRVAIYVDTACELARSFQIDDFPVSPLEVPYPKLKDTDVRPSLYELERFVNLLRARNIFEIDGNLRNAYVVLDENWRTVATTYVQHIRRAVAEAKMNEALREPIMSKLNDLQREIDRNRTRVESLSETWLKVTEAMGQGAENLGPVAKLLEKLSGPLSWLRRKQADEDTKALPPPETLGLPDLSDNGSDKE
jgi:hypothetical protein